MTKSSVLPGRISTRRFWTNVFHRRISTSLKHHRDLVFDIPILNRSLDPSIQRRIAVQDDLAPQNRSFTYSDLLNHSSSIYQIINSLIEPKRIENYKEQENVAPRIAIWSRSGFEYVAIKWAIWRSGWISVPLCSTHPIEELEYYLKDSQCEILVASRPDPNLQLDALAEKLQIKYLDIGLLNPLEPKILHPEFPDPNRKEMREEKFSKEREALIIYTSGTTGKPKGVVLSHGNIQAQIQSLVDAWKWTENDHILNALPLHHIHGIVNASLCALWTGAQISYMSKFSASKVWKRFVMIKNLSLWMAVPTMYVKLIQEYDLASPESQSEMRDACQKFRLMVSGSMALPSSVLLKWKEISGHTLLERYGMTEIGMGLSNPLEGDRKVGYVGKPLPGVLCKISTASDLHNEGELRVKSPSVFKNYWNKPKETIEAFDSEGFFKTGDTVRVDKDGNYKIIGRTSVDIIKSGGYKISALEIEQILLEHPDIQEVAVVGIPDEVYGQILGTIVSTMNPELKLSELRDWCKYRMASYKIPRRLKVVSAIPRNAMGKINKKSLLGLFE